MEYNFKIAGISIRVNSEFPIQWNSYIQEFACELPVKCNLDGVNHNMHCNMNYDKGYDEYYECRFVDEFQVEGELVYEDSFQKIFKAEDHEERLHYFYGYEVPCMHYKEYENRKIIYLNRRYEEIFRGEGNHTIFNAMAFEKVLMQHNAIVLHSSFVIWKGQAILFSAPSGTGKSTQAALWERYADAMIANGDRTILRMKDGVAYACGMPICGSSDICKNVEVPLKAIIYLEQYPENQVEKVPLKSAIKRMLSETTVNFFNTEFLNVVLECITEIALRVPMYHFCCTKEKEAVDVLKEVLEGQIDGSD